MSTASSLRLDMRSRIIEGAIKVVASHGVSASTALMAKQAGVAQGSLFHHFDTKSGLLDAVYAVLKAELRASVTDNLDEALPLQDTLWIIWKRWTDWGTKNPDRRRALQRIALSEHVTPQSRKESEKDNKVGIAVFRQASSKGALRDQPIQFIGALVESLANSTMDMMLLEPDSADEYRAAGFQALRNMLN